MKWEYNKVYASDELTIVELNKLGSDGWELVSVIQLISHKYVSGVYVNTSSLVYHFKKPIE
jgi:hypothetical protein